MVDATALLAFLQGEAGADEVERMRDDADALVGAMSAQPIRYVRDHISGFVNDVERHQDRIEVTRNGRVVAVIVSAEEMSVLEETLSVLSDPVVLAGIRRGGHRIRRR